MEINVNKHTYKEIANEFYKRAIKLGEYSDLTLDDAIFFFENGSGNFREVLFSNDTYDFEELYVKFLAYQHSAR